MDWIIHLLNNNKNVENVKPTCMIHTWRTVENLFKGSTWALKMFDASTKVPSSVLMGNVLDFGNYDECIQVDVQEEWGSFQGQHCLAKVDFPVDANGLSLPSFLKSLPIHWSLCVPSSCSALDLEHLLRSFIPYNITVQPSLCSTSIPEPYQTADIFAISLYLVLALLCAAGTVYSLTVQDSEKGNRWLMAFSWYKNGKSLLSTKQSPDSLPVLHGIRFLSIAWVVLAHTYEYESYLPQLNHLEGTRAIRRWIYLPLVNSAFAVDTFMVLSGLLLSYVFMRSMERGYRFNLIVFYLHRLLRIWPVLGLLLLFQATLITKIGSGPLWNYIITNDQSKICKERWWTTMLFVSNYVDIDKMCMPVAWFLAVDMQLYWVSPIFLLLLLKKPKYGIAAIIGACFLGIAISFQQAYYHRDIASIITTRGFPDHRYYQTHTRFVAWLIGLLCGYVIYKTTDWRNRVAAGRDQLKKELVIGGWILSTVTCIAVMHSIYPMQQEDYVYNVIENALYLALTRPLWALGISWIIFACVSGYGGPVNTLLSWKVMIPLSRLTYCVYLIHFIVLCIILGDTKTAGYLSNKDQLVSFFGYLSFSLIASTIVSLSVETPCLGIEKILLRKAPKGVTNKTSLELGQENQKKHPANIKEQ